MVTLAKRLGERMISRRYAKRVMEKDSSRAGAMKRILDLSKHLVHYKQYNAEWETKFT